MLNPKVEEVVLTSSNASKVVDHGEGAKALEKSVIAVTKLKAFVEAILNGLKKVTQWNRKHWMKGKDGDENLGSQGFSRKANDEHRGKVHNQWQKPVYHSFHVVKTEESWY